MVRVVDNPGKLRFEALLDDEEVGVIKYTRNGNVITLTHTLVPPENSGKGIASILVKESLNLAREAGDRVIPVCPFVLAYLERHPEERDVVLSGV